MSKNPFAVVVSSGSIIIFQDKVIDSVSAGLEVVLVSYHIFMVVSINTVQNRYDIVRISPHDRNDCVIEICL